MKTKILLAIIFAAIVSCNTRSEFDSYIGTYVPLEDINMPLFKKIQIEKRGDLYILACESYISSSGNSILFFVCSTEKNHLSINPSQYLGEENYRNILLTKKTDIYYDKDLMKIYFLNTVFIPSNQKLFEIIDNNIVIKK